MHGTFSGCSPEIVQTIALEDYAIVWFYHFASLSLRESGDMHGTFSGCSPETFQTIALEDYAIVWTMCPFLFLLKKERTEILLLWIKQKNSSGGEQL
ncbi:MAG: hypothetical protein JXK07_02130 [Spirochaetes bacterium]|nr:hypothetical protein [Spirochaetota bacterium]